MYLTATFPYLVLVILLIRGVTLEGSGQGIKYYISPDFKQILSVKVKFKLKKFNFNFNKIFSIKTWYNAANQVFFSLGLGFGALIMYSSFNYFNNNFLRF